MTGYCSKCNEIAVCFIYDECLCKKHAFEKLANQDIGLSYILMEKKELEK